MKTYQNGVSVDFGFGIRFEGLPKNGKAYLLAQGEKQLRKTYNSKSFLDFSVGKRF